MQHTATGHLTEGEKWKSVDKLRRQQALLAHSYWIAMTVLDPEASGNNPSAVIGK